MDELRLDRAGWTVYGLDTDKPAVLDDLVLKEIGNNTADKLVGVLCRNLYGASQKRQSKWPMPPSAAR
jgi:hypothetical protein